MKYPKLPIELNRLRKLTDEQITTIRMMYARGESRFTLAEKYRVSPSTIYYHISPQTQIKNKLRFKERYHSIYKNDPEYRKESIKRGLESRKYRKKVNPKYKEYLAEVQRKRYQKRNLITNL